MTSNFMAELTSRLRDRRQQLEAAERDLAAKTKAAAKAMASYTELCSASNGDFVHPEAGAAHDAAAGLSADVSRQRDLVRDLRAEAAQLDNLTHAPQRLQGAINSLKAARAATVAAVAGRAKVAERVLKLQNQQLAELAAAEVGRAWQQEQILARIEGREPAASPRPEHSPDQCQQAPDLISSMIDTEQKARAQLDSDIAAMRDAERQAEQATLEAQAAVREVELAEAIAAFVPVLVRHRAAHLLAYGFEAELPNLHELSRIDADEAEVEARQVLAAEQPGLLKRAVQRVAEAVAG